MEKHRLKFVIPSMVVVAIGAIFMLRNNYPEVSMRDGVLITLFATLFSGYIAYMLFPRDEEKAPDSKSTNSRKKN
ncbi:hypothetical protein D1B33_11255 [Lysinibacillus yapensis]|uniref:Acyltransferase n=1 Tax=Ureibacillus yapensis TaxID=2304605 RepID=A0A396SCX0_9BACL|nr:hypothetical protein [Lysinibacillus yapensis]RHW36208.1 hypothetical protein D1B33_11255 [Lysinibacillus yapensis]